MEIYIYVAIVRSRLGMQLPFKVNARAPSLQLARPGRLLTAVNADRKQRQRQSENEGGMARLSVLLICRTFEALLTSAMP